MTKDDLKTSRDNMLESLDSLRDDINGEFEDLIAEVEDESCDDDIAESIERIPYVPHPDTLKIVNKFFYGTLIICITVCIVTLLLVGK